MTRAAAAAVEDLRPTVRAGDRTVGGVSRRCQPELARASESHWQPDSEVYLQLDYHPAADSESELSPGP